MCPDTMSTISEAKEILKKYKVNVLGKTANLNEILKMERPLVLKSDSSEHKTDKGLVFVNLQNDEEIKNAFKKISKHSAVFVQPMINGEEVIMGIVEDQTFGKVIMFGAGGIFTEIYRDVAFRIPPLTKSEGTNMIADTKINKVLEGFRGKTFNKKSLIELIVNLSKFAVKEANNFKELDLNPVIVNKTGTYVVDVRLLK